MFDSLLGASLTDIAFGKRRKMGLRWWRDVLIRSQPKRYLDDR